MARLEEIGYKLVEHGAKIHVHPLTIVRLTTVVSY